MRDACICPPRTFLVGNQSYQNDLVATRYLVYKRSDNSVTHTLSLLIPDSRTVPARQILSTCARLPLPRDSTLLGLFHLWTLGTLIEMIEYLTCALNPFARRQESRENMCRYVLLRLKLHSIAAPALGPSHLEVFDLKKRHRFLPSPRRGRLTEYQHPPCRCNHSLVKTAAVLSRQVVAAFQRCIMGASEAITGN